MFPEAKKLASGIYRQDYEWKQPKPLDIPVNWIVPIKTTT